MFPFQNVVDPDAFAHDHGPNKAWSWWVHPLAKRFASTKDRTYWGSVNNGGQRHINYFDHDTSRRGGFFLSEFESDDHNAPAVDATPTGVLYTFYTRHNQDNLLRYRIAASVEALDFGEEQTVEASGNITYVQFFYDTGIDAWRVFYRVDNFNWALRTYTLATQTWSAEQILINGGEQYYIKWREHANWDSGTTRIIRGAAAANPTGTSHDVRIIYIDFASGDVKTISGGTGTVIGNIDGTSLPLAPSDLGVAFTATDTTRVFDVAKASSPTLLFADIQTAGVVSYKLAIFSGGTWTVNTVLADAGDPFWAPSWYMGGAVFEDATNQSIYLAREDAGTWRVEKYTGDANAANWVLDSEIASGAEKHMRPICPVNAHASMPVIYQKGTYTDYSNFDLDAHY